MQGRGRETGREEEKGGRGSRGGRKHTSVPFFENLLYLALIHLDRHLSSVADKPVSTDE